MLESCKGREKQNRRNIMKWLTSLVSLKGIYKSLSQEEIPLLAKLASPIKLN